MSDKGNKFKAKLVAAAMAATSAATLGG